MVIATTVARISYFSLCVNSCVCYKLRGMDDYNGRLDNSWEDAHTQRDITTAYTMYIIHAYTVIPGLVSCETLSTCCCMTHVLYYDSSKQEYPLLCSTNRA